MLILLTVTFLLLFIIIIGIQLSWGDLEVPPTLSSSHPVIRGPATIQSLSSNSHTLSEHDPSSALHVDPQSHANHDNNRRIRGQGLWVSLEVASKDPWAIWKSWVKPEFLYPDKKFLSEEMNHILATMATAPISSFDVGYKGTQLKAMVMLGRQKIVFKPKR